MNRNPTFRDDDDRWTYLRLLRVQLSELEVRLLGWCLMGNHVHLIAVPPAETALSTLLQRVHGRYAQYFNARWERIGHLWQGRFYSCSLGATHFWPALAYVERNPVRAGMVRRAEDYRWSSAAAHLWGEDRERVLDMTWWAGEGPRGWEATLHCDDERLQEIRDCTHAGRPFGDEAFFATMSERTWRRWRPGRPRLHPPIEADPVSLPLFDAEP